MFVRKKENSLYLGKYLELKYRAFSVEKDNKAYDASWEFVKRTNNTTAVVIIPVIKERGSIVLIRQFRVPFWKYIIEYPAGLVENSEDIPTAALRELKEETGYSGQVVFQSPLLSTSAGLTTEIFTLCIVEVDENNICPQNLEPMEDIEVFEVPKKELSKFLYNCSKKDDIIDCKVFLSLNLIQDQLLEK